MKHCGQIDTREKRTEKAGLFKELKNNRKIDNFGLSDTPKRGCFIFINTFRCYCKSLPGRCKLCVINMSSTIKNHYVTGSPFGFWSPAQKDYPPVI